jgi:hypothetical protein
MLRDVIHRARAVPLAVVVVVLGTATVLIPRNSSATTFYGLCDEARVDGSTQHRFGYGGACYQGAPNAQHLNLQVGYCHTYHYECP